ncbi:DUF475 domain-containing protein (plasmid) [Aneurinibacillus sp. Ricciae_BoGa-3]|nr:DUF475 domain-containing protein [Aneurinibacillus sp. Ricciae_BoGa-3]WCK57770.1 DUF475 domain-containing protein [Aneurinibacillus sp. Ricciae_BoGa-3]
MWMHIFTSPQAWGLIGTLVLMEGLLSADNAIVLSAQVSVLPEKQQKKALLYGLWGAYIFRFIVIGFGTALIKLWFIKLLGGLFLVWKVIEFFKNRNKDGEGEEDDAKPSGLAKYIGLFWSTVVSVELMDISFSVDSVMAAFGVSNIVGIVFIGGCLGILMMRGVAQLFTVLMAKVPELEVTAYVIIAYIAVKMLLEIPYIGIELPDVLFFLFLLVSFSITFGIHFARKPKLQN